MAILFGASLQGVLNKLPTFKAAQAAGATIDSDSIEDNLETASSWVIARVGSEGAVPALLTDMARTVVEIGAAALTASSTIPEDDDGTKFAENLWKRFEKGRDELAIGVEREGGAPPPGEMPESLFPPPQLTQWRGW